MEKGKKRNAKGGRVSGPAQPMTLGLAAGGINTSQDFANVMSSLMADLIGGRISPQVGNAVCNAGGKMLKAVEMQIKYGVESKGLPGKKVLALTSAAGDLNDDQLEGGQ